MVLWDSDKNFVPQNEGIVMENYLEVFLNGIPMAEEVMNFTMSLAQIPF